MRVSKNPTPQMQLQGLVIRKHRILKNWNQEELARRIYRSFQAVSFWEQGLSLINPELYQPLAEAFYPGDPRNQLAFYLELSLSGVVEFKEWIDWLFLAQHITSLGANKIGIEVKHAKLRPVRRQARDGSKASSTRTAV